MKEVTSATQLRKSTAGSARVLRLILDSFPGLAQPASNLIGKTVEGAAGKDFWKSIGPSLQRALTGENVTFETRLKNHGNAFRDVRLSYVPDIREDGRVIGLAILISDVTEQKAAATVHKEIERQLTLLIEASGALLASPGAEQVLKNILNLAERFVDADGFAVWRKAPEGGKIGVESEEGAGSTFCFTLPA